MEPVWMRCVRGTNPYGSPLRIHMKSGAHLCKPAKVGQPILANAQKTKLGQPPNSESNDDVSPTDGDGCFWDGKDTSCHVLFVTPVSGRI